MITRKKKEEIVAELTEKLKGATGIYLINYERMNVEETNNFRNELRQQDVYYSVAKNTLLKRALETAEGVEFPDDAFKGASGMVLCYEDPTVPSKIIEKFFKKSERPSLKGASLDGQMFDGTQLKTIASLPSKEDMMAGIVGSLSAPASGIVGSISSLIRDIASMVEEVAKKQNAA